MKNNLVIKLNRNPLPNDCPLCGVQNNPNIGAEIFLSGTESVVCFDCASKHAPVLAALLAFADFSRLFDESGEPLGKRMATYFELSKLFCQSEKVFGKRWECEQNIRRIPKNSFGIQAEVKNV